jgi:hypothetical protein
LQAARRTAETVEQTTEKVQAGSKDMAERTLSAEQNLRTTLDYAERFVRAKDLQEAAQIQSEYVRTQFEAMQSQMREVGSAMQSTMQQATDQAAAAARSGTGQASGQADSPTTTRTRGKGA